MATVVLQTLLLSAVARAQAAATDQADPQSLEQQARGVDMTRPASGSVSGVQLSASTASNQASFNVGTSNPYGRNWSLLFSSPLTMGGTSSGGSSATNTNIATLNGLANGFSATFKLSEFHMNVANGNPATDAIFATAHAACEAKASDKKACDEAPGEVVTDYDSAEKSAYVRGHYRSVLGMVAYTYGLQASVGYNSFTYYRETDLAKASEKDIPRSVGAFFGVVPNNFAAPTLVDFSVKYQQAYKASSSTTACKSLGASVSCETGSIGVPKQTDGFLLSIDENTEFGTGKHFVGISPQVTYDVKTSEKGIDFPVYFISDAKGNLIAGISAGWTNIDHFSVGLIVGAPFSFFSQ